MSVKQVSVNVASEVDDALVALRDLVVALKAGKSVQDIVVAELAEIMQVMGELNKIPQDLSQTPRESLAAVGLRLAEIGAILLGK